MIISLMIAIIEVSLLAGYQAVAITAPSSSQTATVNNPAPEETCTFLVFTDGTTSYMQSCATDAVLFNSTSAYSVIQDAVQNASGGSVFIKAGLYVISNQITPTVSNVTLYGEGWGKTILKANTNIVNTSRLLTTEDGILALYDVTGWTVKDIEFNGNKVNQAGSGAGNPDLDCVGAFSSTRVVFDDVFVHDCKTYGIHVGSYGYSEILDNYVLNANADGIVLYSYPTNSYGNDIVSRNIVVGSSDVGISLQLLKYTVVSDNEVAGINQSVSPWAINSHNGIDAETSDSYTQIVGNLVTFCPGNGIESAPSTTNYNMGINSNTIADIGNGVYVYNTQRATISNNIIDSTMGNNGMGIYLYTNANDIVVSGNEISDTIGDGILGNGGLATITGNIIRLTSTTSPGKFGIMVKANNNTVSDNLVDSTGTTNAEYGIEANIGYYGISIIGNTIQGYPGNLQDEGIGLEASYSSAIGNTVGGYAICIYAAFGTDEIVSNNGLSKSSCHFSIIASGLQVITSNIGYNPMGHLSSPFDDTNNYVCDNCGSSTPHNATTMTVTASPKIIMIVIGSGWTSAHTLVIKIDGTQIISTATPAANTVYTFTLNPLETFYIQYQSGQATFIVSGE